MAEVLRYAIENESQEWFRNAHLGHKYDGSIPTEFYWARNIHEAVVFTNEQDANEYLEESGPIVGYYNTSDLKVTEHMIVGDVPFCQDDKLN